jgi:hypothetical protein
MDIEIWTKESLEKFKQDLLIAIKELITHEAGSRSIAAKKWYKAAEVRKLLGVSSGKLQHMRIKGLLRSSKIGGVHYYKATDIERMFQQHYSGLHSGWK